jgi:hypothetical protein
MPGSSPGMTSVCLRRHRDSSHIASRSRRANPREFCHRPPAPRIQRAQGMPGARCARSRVWCVESTRVSHHGHAGITRHSPRNGFNGFLRALPGDRACLPPSSSGVTSAGLDAGVEASGPHDFAVRKQRPRLWRRPRPPHPTAYVRDDRETPLRGGGTESQYSCFYPAVKLNSENPKLVAARRMG